MNVLAATDRGYVVARLAACFAVNVLAMGVSALAPKGKAAPENVTFHVAYTLKLAVNSPFNCRTLPPSTFARNVGMLTRGTPEANAVTITFWLLVRPSALVTATPMLYV
jgi:hypothetical protein